MKKEEQTPDHPLLEELSFLEPPEHVGDRAADAVDDRQLEAYRRGELDEAATAMLERRLSRDAAARARLLALGGEQLPAPSPFLRARVLRGFKDRRAESPRAADSRVEDSKPARRSSSRPKWAPVLVAALLLISVAGLLLRGGGGGALPEGLAYEVSARGLADVRSQALDADAAIEAHADTSIELVVVPAGVAEGRVEFAVYRLESGSWLRVATNEQATVERGSAVFELPARQLVGSEPGDYQLLVAVARPGALPARLDPARVEEEAADYRFYRRRVTLLR